MSSVSGFHFEPLLANFLMIQCTPDRFRCRGPACARMAQSGIIMHRGPRRDHGHRQAEQWALPHSDPAVGVDSAQCDLGPRPSLPVDLDESEIHIDERSGHPETVGRFRILLVDVGQAARREVDDSEWPLVSGRDLGEVHVAGQQHDPALAGRSQEIEETLTLEGVVAPLVHALLVRDDLDARGDETYLRRSAELVFEPRPLLIAKQGGFRVRVRGELAETAARPFRPLGEYGQALEGRVSSRTI